LSAAVPLPPGVRVFERGWLSANNILFEGKDHSALVDSGYVLHAEQTVALVKAALGARPLDALFNTHLHSDHCGGNAALQAAFPGVRTAVPPGEASAVANWDEETLSYRATGQECARFRADAVVQPGDLLSLADIDWEVHAAPGHDPHSVILFEPASRTLISADALWESGFGVVFPELAGEPSFEEVASTLDLIETLDPRIVIPGHGSIFCDAALALSRSRSRLASFAKSPQRHARHALKVLVKFRLLASRQMTMVFYQRWLSETPYIEMVRQRFYPDMSMTQLGTELAADLCNSGVARQDADRLIDI